MRDHGCLRVGTLHDYRTSESYGEMVSDNSEGTRLVSGSVSVTPESQADFPGLRGLLKHTGPPGSKPAKLTMHGVKVGDASNYMVFSASLQYSAAAHRRWAESEGYNACYRIFAPRLFVRTISEALGSDFELFGGAPITYEDEIDLAGEQMAIPPLYIKRRADVYLDQSEFRAAWRPLNQFAKLTPIVFNSSRARLYVELQAVLGNPIDAGPRDA